MIQVATTHYQRGPGRTACGRVIRDTNHVRAVTLLTAVTCDKCQETRLFKDRANQLLLEELPNRVVKMALEKARQSLGVARSEADFLLQVINKSVPSKVMPTKLAVTSAKEMLLTAYNELTVLERLLP